MDALYAGNIQEGVSILEQSVNTWADSPSLCLLGKCHVSRQYDFCNPLYGASLIWRCVARGYHEAKVLKFDCFPHAYSHPRKPQAPQPKEPSQAQKDLFLYAKTLEKLGNTEKAIRLYKDLSDVHAEANLRLSELLMGTELETSAECLKRAIQLGDKTASALLATLYRQSLAENPKSDPENLIKFEKHILKDAPAHGCHFLGLYHLDPKKPQYRFDKSIYYLRKGAALGKPELYKLIADCYTGKAFFGTADNDQHRYWLEYGARRGSTSCMALLAYHYAMLGAAEYYDQIRLWAERCYKESTDPDEKSTVAELLNCFDIDPDKL